MPLFWVFDLLTIYTRYSHFIHIIFTYYSHSINISIHILFTFYKHFTNEMVNEFNGRRNLPKEKGYFFIS